MYFFNNFIIYSIFGFVMESTIYKIKNSTLHSGILFGPYTLVYGLGIIIILIINKLVEHIKINKFLRNLLLFLILTISLTLIEWLGGNLINLLFNIDMWDYSNHKFHLGKYVSLEISIIWGILGLIFIYFVKPFTDKLCDIIYPVTTKTIMFIIFVDSIITLILKKK